MLALIKQMTVWYVLVGDNGQERRSVVVASGASENRTPAYAMKGALTNAIDNAVSNLGFQESMYLGKRSHATIGRKNGAGKTPPSPTASATPPRPANGKAPASAAPARNSNVQAFRGQPHSSIHPASPNWLVPGEHFHTNTACVEGLIAKVWTYNADVYARVAIL